MSAADTQECCPCTYLIIQDVSIGCCHCPALYREAYPSKFHAGPLTALSARAAASHLCVATSSKTSAETIEISTAGYRVAERCACHASLPSSNCYLPAWTVHNAYIVLISIAARSSLPMSLKRASQSEANALIASCIGRPACTVTQTHDKSRPSHVTNDITAIAGSKDATHLHSCLTEVQAVHDAEQPMAECDPLLQRECAAVPSRGFPW